MIGLAGQSLVFLYTDDLPRLAGFYGGVLGLEEVLPMPARVCEFWARARREGRDPFEGYDLRDAWRNETTYDDVWRNFFPRGTDPWGASVTGEPWAQRGEKTRLGSLAMLVWAPILEAQA